MKTGIFTVLLVTGALQVLAQDTTPVTDGPKTGRKARKSAEAPAEPAATKGYQAFPLKTNDQFLPRIFLDLNYRAGTLGQKYGMMNLAGAYKNSIRADIPDPTFSGGYSSGADIQLGCFFFKKRQFGLSTGLLYLSQRGTITMDRFHVEYESKDGQDTTFRQIITARDGGRGSGRIVEDLQMTSWSIPLMLKYKHQFNKSAKGLHASRLGITVDAGGFLTISNTHTYNAAANFDYEAVYYYDPERNGHFYYDAGSPHNSTSMVYTYDGLASDKPGAGDVAGKFAQLRSDGLNVGLNVPVGQAQKSGNYSFNDVSYGFLGQAGLTYYLGYRATLMVGAHFMYQMFGNKDNEGYRTTDRITTREGRAEAEYHTLMGGASRVTASSLGFNVGLRFFLGGKPDRDGDKVPDYREKPECRERYGLVDGCPDRDEDGVLDMDDRCPDDPGDRSAAGCKDKDMDGVPDDEDACKNIFGVKVDNPKTNGCPQRQEGTRYYIETAENPNPALPKTDLVYDILETHTIQFAYNEAALEAYIHPALDSAVRVLKDNPKVVILISGFTDNIGSWAYNMRLSDRRAQAVSEYLQSKGIDLTRIITAAYGKDKPLNNNEDEESRARNRRIEMKLLLQVEPKK